jgi:hypothetical protein
MDGAATIITAVDKIIKRLEASKARLRVLRAKLASDMAALYLGEITSQEVEGIRQEIREIKSFLA